MVPRLLAAPLRESVRQLPVVTITGPRQSGKTTLTRATFPQFDYVSLEAPDRRELALSDPRSFLARLSGPAILDEIQRAPELVSYIQELVDDRGEAGQFVLTGSQQLRVSESISQSLAGRTALLRLLPFSLPELEPISVASTDLSTLLHAGFYPRIHDRQLDPTRAHGDYFETYVERDLRQVGEVRNLSGFRRFVRLCAGRVGGLLNLSSLGNDAGVSHTTAREWLSLLEASFIAFLLEPYHANVSKRLIKSPKLYFYDVGLAAYLIGVEEPRQLDTHPLRGALFENLVVVEALKHRWNAGRRSNLFFYRDAKGNEVDLLAVSADRIHAIEVKAGATISRDMFKGFDALRSVLGDRIVAETLVYGGDDEGERRGVAITNARGLVGRMS